MKLETALILSAGFGKRLKPVTLKKPKPLIKIKKKILLDNTIDILIKIGIKNIKINTFYLSDQIKNFVHKHHRNKKIEIIHDGKKILGTGGAISKLSKKINDQNIIVINPDTIWTKNYLKSLNKMIKFYKKNKIKNILLLVNKSKSFDRTLKGDFDLKSNRVYFNKPEFIYTGFQIINLDLFKKYKKKIFSISRIWDYLIKKNELYGFESKNKFIHITDYKIYKQLIKND